MLLALLLPAMGRAQAPVDAARAKANPATLPSTADSREASSGNAPVVARLASDAEYGQQVVLTRKAHPNPWSLQADAQYFYTDNVALAHREPLSDGYLRANATLQYTNRINRNLFLSASVENAFYAHSKYSELDFHLLRTEAGLFLRLPKLADSYLSLRYVWYRISEADFRSTAFQEHQISLGWNKVWAISRGQEIFGGLSADVSVSADPSPPRRDDYSAYLGYRLRLTEPLSFQVSYRGAYYWHPEQRRDDWNHTVLFGCTYALTDWARVEVSVSESWNRSSASNFSYHNLVTGGGITLHKEF